MEAPTDIECASQVTGHTGAESLGEALTGAEVVIIPAGVPRKPGMTRDDLFNINAGIVKILAEATAKHAPGVSWQALNFSENSLPAGSGFEALLQEQLEVAFVLSENLGQRAGIWKISSFVDYCFDQTAGCQ